MVFFNTGVFDIFVKAEVCFVIEEGAGAGSRGFATVDTTGWTGGPALSSTRVAVSCYKWT